MYGFEQKGQNCMETKQAKGKSEGPPKLIDRRVQRTQQLLQEALISLILEKGYEAITVQDIIDKANVGRSTFYAHFLDKDHLFTSGLEKLRDSFEEQHQKIRMAQSSPKGKTNSDAQRVEMTLIIFQHVQSYHLIYKALVGKRGGELATQQIISYVTDMLHEHLSAAWSGKQPPEIPIEVVVHFMASTLISLLTWWLDHDLPYSAEQMNSWFLTLSRTPLLITFFEPTANK